MVVTAEPNFAIVENDAIQEEAHISAAGADLAGTQRRSQRGAVRAHLASSERWKLGPDISQVGDLAISFDALRLEAPEPLGKFCIVKRDDPTLNRLVHAGDPCVEIGLAREQAIELPRGVVLGLPFACDRAFQQPAESRRLKKYVGEMIHHQIVEQAFTDRPAGTAFGAEAMRG